MRVLLRLNAPFFISWGMEMLIGQLYDLSSDVADEAIDILDEACEEEVYVQYNEYTCIFCISYQNLQCLYIEIIYTCMWKTVLFLFTVHIYIV